MIAEQILAQPPRVLTEAQRNAYFTNGYLLVEGLIPPAELAELQAVTAAFIDRSRAERASGPTFDLAPGHSATRPMVRRLKRPDEQHERYWQFATGVVADVVADLVGPDVAFHHSKLNFKWHQGGDEVKWHQDIQFYPHTNYSPLTVGLYLQDVGMDDGPLMAIAGSHDGPLFDQYDADGNWVGSLGDADAATLDLTKVAYLTGPAGAITIHNCRTVHGSPGSNRADGRPLLLNAYSSADARAYTPHPDPSAHAYEVIRGHPARWAHHDPRPCLIPPDWSGGYTSIFAAQAGEDADKTAAE